MIKNVSAECTHRALRAEEIATLLAQGCSCDDWSRVKVADGFDAAKVRNVEFCGDVRLGTLNGVFERPGGMVRRSLLTDVTLCNVSVGDDCYIRGVASYIVNYDIENHVFIEDVDCITGTLDSSFGIGTEVSVLNETGGREVPVYERLSSQTAYMIAMYRHRDAMVDRLCAMIRAEAAALRGSRGRIGCDAVIVNCGTITDVNIGRCARLKGATRLADGTITGDDDNVAVGRDVIAEGFVFAAGSRVDDGAVVHHCFIGQSTSLSHLFSAHDSLFFANCTCENGEAAAIFGGPYTVTMHKSSLLIARIFSFLNAGSGSNQSNHMYKLGPIHQGVVERGSKTTSDSYILWPAKIGAFSLVMGRHVNHPDTSGLPFSYLIENREGSFLVPGVNLRSVGTIRDARKWPKRDKRKTADLLDCINFNLLSPYTVGRMMSGGRLLNDLERTAGITAERFSFQALIIEARALRKGRKYYGLAIDKFMGNSLISRLGDAEIGDDTDFAALLAPTHPAGCGEWVDVCGMFAPKAEVERIAADIESGAIDSLDILERRWRTLHADYYDMEWTWVCEHFAEWYGKEVTELDREDVRTIVSRWIKSVTMLNDMLLDDAAKEYSLKSRIGFGIDNPEESAEGDFTNVRGDYDCDPFVISVREHTAAKRRLAERFL
ncbi:MAG: DUF4954 family protein [Bacteroidales bacterium]|nr:DUF4954 family protein [Bacteroidales bacterium]